MTIIHTVFFEFKASTSPDDIQDVCQRMLGLKDQCIHPTSNKPYITSLVGGKDNSVEGFQNGFTHGFVVEFEKEADRDYYTKEDPAHANFVKSIRPLINQIQVIDFTPGKY